MCFSGLFIWTLLCPKSVQSWNMLSWNSSIQKNYLGKLYIFLSCEEKRKSIHNNIINVVFIILMSNRVNFNKHCHYQWENIFSSLAWNLLPQYLKLSVSEIGGLLSEPPGWHFQIESMGNNHILTFLVYWVRFIIKIILAL